MALPSGIAQWKIDSFKNAHENFIQPLDQNMSYDLYINDPSWASLSEIEQYNKCTENLQWIIKDALDKRLNIRAMGSGWSLSKVAVSEDAIINTKGLRHKFTLSAKHFMKDYLGKGNKPENHRFLQCGNTIISINDHLENKSKPPKSLRASGGSNGQTIVGAFSTNTHGAALNYGALSEMILGIHIVTSPDNHYYLERASRPVTSTHFHNLIKAQPIIDDDLFNAALISFGSFGIIHGVLLEVEDKFLLQQRLSRIAFDEGLEQAIASSNFNNIPTAQHPNGHPLYHFELAINPHDFKFNSKEKGTYMRVMHKLPYNGDYTPTDHNRIKYTYGDDTLGLMQSVLDLVESSAGFLNRLLVPRMVNYLFELAYDRPEAAIGTIGETFQNTVFRGKLFSAAFGLERKHVKKVIELCLEINKSTSLAGVMAFRFVKGTSATLGFTKFPEGCVMELDGVDAKINHEFARKLAGKLEADNIPYTLHWGKINRILSKDRVEKMYGAENVDQWKQQRSRIMSEEIQSLFNNEFMEQCGLDDYKPSTPYPIIT